MKAKVPIVITLALLALSTLNSQISTCFAQGSLTPPGAPGPTMVTLSQIEPRTPIATNTTPGNSSYEFIISQPGSYYLTTNIVGVSLKDGIGIQTNNVTLDLNGFSLLGAEVGQVGIVVSPSANDVTVRNGMISGWGDGMVLEGNGSVSGCLVANSLVYGINITGSGWQILGNNCVSNSNIAILINGSNNLIEGNHVATSSGIVGIEVTGAEYTNNVIIKNIVFGNGANNYVNPGNNDFGPIGTAATSTSPWANISH